MRKIMKTLFSRPSLSRVEEEARQQAQYELFQHRAAAEYHLAMVGMYEQRIARLRSNEKVAA
jgi:hypothetical protein